MEQLVSDMLGFLITVILVVLLFLFGFLLYNVNQYNDFKNQCIEVAQRTGGMNDVAIKSLGQPTDRKNGSTGPTDLDYYNRLNYEGRDDYRANTKSVSGNYYHGHFMVLPGSNKKDSNADYGKPIRFIILSDVPTNAKRGASGWAGIFGRFTKLGSNILIPNQIVTRSQVRQNSQNSGASNNNNYMS